MPYRCVHCSKIYKDGAKEILEGCDCRSKFFFYIREEKLNEVLQNQIKEPELTIIEKEQMEEDVREIAGVNDEAPVFLDFESVKIVKPGKYLLDLQKLFSRDKPRVYKLEDGKYIVDLAPMGKIEARSRDEKGFN